MQVTYAPTGQRSRHIMARIMSLILGITMLAGLNVATGSTARAAGNPYTAVGVCNSEAPGSGYYVQHSHRLPGARVYQLYNGSYNCAVTIKTAHVGESTATTACIQVTGKDWKCDYDNYKYYAGAVWYYGKGKCARYFGFHGGENFTSRWGNCG